jgi:NTE family protein
MRASGSFPALFPPVPLNGHLLVDGGLFTNLPVEQMLHLCPGPIIASDVSNDTDVEVDPSLVDAPSLRQVLWGAVNPLARRVRFPGLGTVLHRSIEAREAGQRAHLRHEIAFCFTPPVERYALDAILKLDEIAGVGYDYATQAVAQLPPSIARTLPQA